MPEFRDKVEKVLEDHVRPVLAMHGGGVDLLEVDEESKDIKIAFAGACHSCAIADVTFDNVIEKVLKEEIPELGKIGVQK